MTTKEHAAQLRADLKARGWSSRHVSVRVDSYSMGSSIDVTVKDQAVPLAAVKELAEGHERIHRCEYSGEILGGGNRYVSVRISEECRTILARRFIAQVEDAAERLRAEPEPTNVLIPVVGTDAMLGRPFTGALSLWMGDRHAGQYSDPHGLNEVACAIALARQ